MLHTFNDRISLTSDIWTSIFDESFHCITAHWIDDEWYIKKRIICFDAMKERHTSYNLKVRIIECLKTFHLLDKVFSLSLDNASANTKCIDYLISKPSLKLLNSEELLHVHCCAHIIKLSV